MDLQPLQHLFQLQEGCTLRSRIITLDERDLRSHIIEAFPSTTPEPTSLPLILLLHGFPELAFSWRKILAPLAVSRGGYHVIAPDLRGYGRTVTHQIHYDDPIAPFHLLNIAHDVRALVLAIGHSSVSLLVGHDLGSLVAGHCVTAFPDIFRSVVFMSAPFAGIERPLPRPDDPASTPERPSLSGLFHALAAALAALSPPRKHYVAYFASRNANADMLGDGDTDALDAFLGGYYHIKSGAWHGNATARPLPSASPPSPSASESAPPTIDAIARDLASLPGYYVMPAHEHMRQVVARLAAAVDGNQCTWPPGGEESDAGRVYASEFARTGFQGGLNYYRAALSPPPAERVDELAALSSSEPGQGARSPAAFVAGARDWGVYQRPGELEKMRLHFGMQNEDVVLIEGAGHWVQQEAPDRVVAALLRFLDRVERA